MIMEAEKHLQALIERARALHDRINDEIYNSCVGFRGICPRDSRFGEFADGPSADTQSLTAISEALQMVGNMLLSLQRLQSQQQTERHTALMRLGESRSFLTKKIIDHHRRNLEVIEELRAFVKNQTENLIQGANNPFEVTINIYDQEGGRQIKKRIVAFLKSCIWIFLDPLKLQKATTRVERFEAFMAGVVSVHLPCQSKQECTIGGTETLYPIRGSHGIQDNFLSKSAESETLGLANNKSRLDVLYGRG